MNAKDDTMQLTGKTFFVTSAAQGIGRSDVDPFQAEAANVIDVAALVFLLAWDDARMRTGRECWVDAGWR